MIRRERSHVARLRGQIGGNPLTDMAPEERARAGSPFGYCSRQMLLAGFRPTAVTASARDVEPHPLRGNRAKRRPRASLAASTPNRDDISAAWIHTIGRSIDLNPDRYPPRSHVHRTALRDGDAVARQFLTALFASAISANATYRDYESSRRGRRCRPLPTLPVHRRSQYIGQARAAPASLVTLPEIARNGARTYASSGYVTTQP